MRIITPYVPELRRAEAVAALAALGRPIEELAISRDDRFAYLRAVTQLWRSGEDFLLLEHDCVVGSEHVAGLESCPAPWCSVVQPYPDPAGADGYAISSSCAGTAAP